MNKRTTLVVDEDNWKRYEKLKSEKLRLGQGDISFTSYANICLSESNLTLSEIVEKLRLRKKRRDNA